jgi:hypothetical protein
VEAESNWRGLLAAQAFPSAASLGSQPAGRRCPNNLRGQWMRWHVCVGVCYVSFRLSLVCVRCRRRILFWGETVGTNRLQNVRETFGYQYLSPTTMYYFLYFLNIFLSKFSQNDKLCETDVVIRMGTQTEQDNTTFLQYVVWTIMLPNVWLDNDGEDRVVW